MSDIVRVVVFNLKNGGWNPATRFHDHTKLLDSIAQAPAIPHLLFLPECTYYRWFEDQPLWEATNGLNKLLPDNDHYYPFISEGVGRKNHAGLFVSAQMVEPVTWKRPDGDTRTIMQNVLECRIAGHTALVKCIHWDGSGGPHWFDIQSAQTGELAAKPTLLAGDFNCPSRAEPLPTAQEWLRRNARTLWKLRQKARRRKGLWTPQSEPFDDLLEAGFWDAAQIAKDVTPTTVEKDGVSSGLLIDRAAVSHKLPARLVEGSYRVLNPGDGAFSDHLLVYFELEFAAQFAGHYALAA